MNSVSLSQALGSLVAVSFLSQPKCAMPRSCDMCCAPYSGGGSAYTCNGACSRRRGWRRGDVARALAQGRIPAGLHHRSPLQIRTDEVQLALISSRARSEQIGSASKQQLAGQKPTASSTCAASSVTSTATGDKLLRWGGASSHRRGGAGSHLTTALSVHNSPCAG